MNSMISLIQRLEGQPARGRKRTILQFLDSERIPFSLHRYRELFVPTDNIIVAKQGRSSREILLLSHYDTYHGNPGANDNASSVAVSLNVITRLLHENTYCTVKAVIFDDEEPCPWRPRPCLGSRKYVAEHGLQDVSGVFCLELCGAGDTVVVWPVSEADAGSVVLSSMSEVCTASGIPYELIAKLPGFTSDFMPFRKAGVYEAFCMSIAPSKERERLRALFSASILKLLFCVEIPKLFGFTKHLPELIRYYHTKNDRAKNLSEQSLQIAADTLYNAVLNYDDKVRRANPEPA